MCYLVYYRVNSLSVVICQSLAFPRNAVEPDPRGRVGNHSHVLLYAAFCAVFLPFSAGRLPARASSVYFLSPSPAECAASASIPQASYDSFLLFLSYFIISAPVRVPTIFLALLTLKDLTKQFRYWRRSDQMYTFVSGLSSKSVLVRFRSTLLSHHPPPPLALPSPLLTLSRPTLYPPTPASPPRAGGQPSLARPPVAHLPSLHSRLPVVLHYRYSGPIDVLPPSHLSLQADIPP